MGVFSGIGSPFHGFNSALPVPAPDTVRRATNVGGSIMEQGVVGGAIVRQANRRPMILPFGVRRVMAIIPLFTVVSNATLPPTVAASAQSHIDTINSENRKFQLGIRPSWSANPAAAGTAAALLFGGSPTLDATVASIDAAKPWAETGWLDVSIPADTKFDLRCEVVAAVGQVPSTLTAFGTNQPDYGLANLTADTGDVASRTSFSSVQSGGSTFYGGAIWIFESDGTGDAGYQVVINGDSNAYAHPYDKGSIWGAAGALERGFFERRRWPSVNLGRGSDGHYSQSVDANSRFRRALAARIDEICGVDRLVDAMGTNDCTKNYVAVPAYANSTVYADGALVNSAGNGLYICTMAGTSKATGALTGAGRNIVDGTAEWAQLTATNSGLMQGVARIVANKYVSLKRWKAAMPRAQLVDTLVLPQTTSTDNWTTVANQTVQSSNNAWGTATGSRRGICNGLARDKLDLFGATAVLDPNAYVEDSFPPTETSKWRADGVTAKLYTQDGQHMTTYAAVAASQMVDVLF